jgi:MFS family permease
MPSAALRPLRSRNFALVWSAALVSNIGSWMQTVAVGVYVTDVTGHAGWTGLVAAAAFLPVGLLSPVGGAMADRLDRRRWLIATTAGETVLAALLAVLAGTGTASPGAVTFLVFLGGAMASLGFPAYQAMLPDLVPREDLLGAISLGSAQFNFGRVVGPAAAGLVIAVGSYTWAFAVNAVSFAAVLVALSIVQLPVVEHTSGGARLWARIREGIDVARADTGCRSAILLISVTALLASPFIALIPAVAQMLLDGGAGATSLLVTAQGVGAVAGALLQAPLAQRFGRRHVLMANLVAVPLTLVLYALSPSLPFAALALVGVGAAYIGVLSGLNTVVQLRAPDAARARVLSLYMLALGVVYPLCAVLQGWLGDAIGLRWVTSGGAVAMLAALGIVATARPALLAALDDPASTHAEAA